MRFFFNCALWFFIAAKGRPARVQHCPFRSISLTRVIATIRKFLMYGLFYIIVLRNGSWKWHGFSEKSEGFEKCSSCLVFIHTICMLSINILRVENLCEKTLKLAIYQANKLCLAFSWSRFSSAWPTRMVLVTDLTIYSCPIDF